MCTLCIPSELEDEEDGDVSEHDSDNVSSRVPLPPNSASSLMKENLVTKGKRKKRESTRKMHQKEMKHSKRKVRVRYTVFKCFPQRCYTASEVTLCMELSRNVSRAVHVAIL